MRCFRLLKGIVQCVLKYPTAAVIQPTIMSCVIGIVGAFIGDFLANLIGLGGGIIVTILIDIAEACILIALLRLILGKKW